MPESIIEIWNSGCPPRIGPPVPFNDICGCPAWKHWGRSPECPVLQVEIEHILKHVWYCKFGSGYDCRLDAASRIWDKDGKKSSQYPNVSYDELHPMKPCIFCGKETTHIHLSEHINKATGARAVFICPKCRATRLVANV
jgi:hypothetical protein